MHTIKILFTGVAIILSYLVGFSSDLLTSCSSPEVRAKVMTTASGELYVRENLGPNDALRIREYKRDINSKFDYPVAWCAIFVSWVYTSSGLKDKIPHGPEWVPSWSSNEKYIIYKRGHATNQIPCPGDVVTFYYPKSRREGHVGLVKSWPEGNYFYTIEGNFGGGVKVVMRRKTDAYKIMRFI